MTAATPPAGAGLRRRLEAHIDRLPVLPQAVARLLSLDPADDGYFDDVVLLLESEPNFAARVLMAANSAASAPTNPVSTLQGAVARIGSRGASNLVLALSVTTVFVPRTPWEQSLWRHGVQVAHAARALATLAADPHLDPEVVYATALLHDIGRLVMFQEAPEQLQQVDEGDWDTPAALVEQELAICGMSHGEIGALACSRWRLPEPIVSAVRHHHDPLPATFETAADKATAITRLADLAMFPSAMPGSPNLAESLDAEQLRAALGPYLPPFLEVAAHRLHALVQTTAADADAACRALGIGG